jgi:hypothetical protein
VYCEILKNCVRPFRTISVECWPTELCSSMAMHTCIQLLALRQCWSISTGSCLTTIPKALISLWVTTTRLPTWRSRWDHSASTIMRRNNERCQKVIELTGFFDTGVQKHNPQYDRCLNFGGDYAER